jgi:hypothetical protein
MTEATGTERTEGTGSHGATEQQRNNGEENFFSVVLLRSFVALCDPVPSVLSVPVPVPSVLSVPVPSVSSVTK